MLRNRLAEAGLGQMPPVAFVMLSLMFAVAAGALSHAILSIAAASLIAAIAGGLLPLLLVNQRARHRRNTNRSAWPDIVDHLVAAVRSGLALPDGVSALAHTGPAATRDAFASFAADYRRTGNFSPCLDRLKDQLADPVADRVIETLRMAREVGGHDLTGVLRALAAHLRLDAAIRAEVRARQGWILNAARLGVAAPWVVLLMLGSRAEAAHAYNTPAGLALIVVGAVVSVLAYRLMLAIGHLPEEKRWFG